MRRLKNFLWLSYGDSLAAESRTEGIHPVYGSNGIVGFHNAHNMGAPAIIVGRKGSFGKVTWAEAGGFCIDTAFFVDQRKCGGNLRFAYYLLSAIGLDATSSRDTGVPGLERFDAHNRAIRVPELLTQRQIADFLDGETARIDLLIEKKQRFLDVLENEFIDRVTLHVTGHGSNERSWKASGYDWNPRIPDSWTAPRLKFLCNRIVDCLHETPEHDDSGIFPSIRTADIRRGKIFFDTAKRVNELEYLKRIQRLRPEEDDVVYTREGERFGLAALIPRGIKCCLGQRMMMFRTNNRIMPAYLMWSLNGWFAYHYLKQGTAGATSPHLNIADIRNVPIFLPPHEQQAVICREIGARFTLKERSLALVSQTVDRLREYRSALVTAAVTGQIDPATWKRKGEGQRRLDRIEERSPA